MNYLDLAIKSILVATFGWLILSLLRRSSASTRHLALLMTIIGVTLLPAASLFVPSWQVPFLQVTESLAASPGIASGSVSSGANLQAHAASPFNHSVPSAPNILLIAWSVVAGILVLRLVVRLVRLRMAERQMPMSVNSELHRVVAELCRRSSRHVVLLEGEAGKPPMTWGFSRPVLVLPSDAQTWPVDRIESVVLHELAHIERGDWLASIVAQFSCAIYWFNPFVWVIRKQMDQESETAADDKVLSAGVPATQYASHLVSVTRELSTVRSSTDVALAMARPGTLDRRVRAILEARRCRRSVRGVVSLGLAAVITGIVVVLGTAVPSIRHRLPLQGPSVSIDVKPTLENGAESDVSNIAPMDDFENAFSDGQRGPNPHVSRISADKVARTVVKKPALTSVKSAVSVISAAPQVSPKHPSPKVGTASVSVGSQPEIGEMKIDFKQMEAEMKKAGIEVDAETHRALNEVSMTNFDGKGLSEMIMKATAASTKAAIASAQKIAKTEIKSALEQLKHHAHDEAPPHVKSGS